jgi:hypothetical protein
MEAPDLDERLRRSKVGPFLLADEVPILAQHQHWAKIAEPVASAIAAFILVIVLNIRLSASLLTDLLWWALFAVVVRAALKWFLWRREWLVATDQRLLVNYGLIHEGVAMLSLVRVVDLTYTRTAIAKLLGYGTLERESTGEGQTLHEIKWVKHPQETYLTISAAIFSLPNRPREKVDRRAGQRLQDSPAEHIPELYAGYTSLSGREAADAAGQPELAQSAQAEPGVDEDSMEKAIRYGVPQPSKRTPDYRAPDYESPDLRGPVRDADTGPIPFRPSTTDGDTWRTTTDEQDQDLDPDQGDDVDVDDND